MTTLKFRRVLLVLLLLAVAGVALGQYGRGRGRRSYSQSQIETPRDWPGYEFPVWTNKTGFEKDVFTFVRVRYQSTSYRGRGGGWDIDVPESDMNFSWRLQQLTSLKVDPNGLFLNITDPRLFDHPFIYMIEPGSLEFTEDEVKALRRYLLAGGFMMVDDFWGEEEWENFYYEIKRVFPEYEPVELPLEHPIFHCVYDLKEKPQMPAIGRWLQWGVTYEREDAKEVHYKAIFDDKKRMMMIICHNTDLGDGWEEERSSPDYFRRFSEKFAYPMGINIIFYAMTH